MASPSIYGAGLIYGSGALYGRITAGLAAAQIATSRSTGLKVSLIDESINNWSDVIEDVPNNARELFSGLGNNATLQTYWSYRRQNDSALLNNGNIIRVRVGDGSTSDFGIYTQNVASPFNTSDFNTWTLLYSGTNYGIAVVPNGASGYDVYHTKVDGLYKNNVLIWTKDNLVSIRHIEGTTAGLFISRVQDDPRDSVNNLRDMDLWWTPNAGVTTPTYDPINYRWYRNGIDALIAPDGRMFRYQAVALYQNPRTYQNGDTIFLSICPSATDNTPSAPRWIRGLAGQVGHNTVSGIQIYKLDDGYYYLFYSEAHSDVNFDSTATENFLVQWQRSKDGLHWSEPAAKGGAIPTAMVHAGGYYWGFSWQAVFRRPDASVVYDISNYVTNTEFEIPRNNQGGSGQATVANPAGINDTIINLSDRRLKVEVGAKNESNGVYEFVQFNDWWIKNITKDLDGKIDRLKINFNDIWERLANPLRDTYNFIGQLKWNDWSTGRRNKAFNYYFLSDSAPVVTVDDRLKTKGVVLYTGWKGQNADVSVNFSSVSGNPRIIFRYLDTKNYSFVEKVGSTLRIVELINNVETEYNSAACSSDTSPTIRLSIKWTFYQAWVNGALILDSSYADSVNILPGYVGFKATAYTLSNLAITDWETTLTVDELARTALAMGDYHDVICGSSSAEEVAILWGPQTDIPTAADGLRQALTTLKWEMVWVDGFILIGSFKDLSIVRVLQNEIIKTDYQDEANRRINLASVDGNEHTWIETDVVDTKDRDRQINAYFDLPELSDQDSVRERAVEEVRRGQMGKTPGGELPLQFDLWRMDVITWIDNSGASKNVRIEGMSVTIDQSKTPSQRQTLDTSLLS